ncbi:MAG: HNH endonuclease [Verrucomicrobia bacterium]|nr:HNH endonuclease [Verrucomicrobiota bacterium]
MSSCAKCGSNDFGLWTSATTGRVSRYCRACRRLRAAAYSARKSASGHRHTRTEWLAKLSLFDYCPICERPWSSIPPRPDRRYRYVWTQDHIIPLACGGTDDISNIQPACYQCNSGKCDGRTPKSKMPDQFYRKAFQCT